MDSSGRAGVNDGFVGLELKQQPSGDYRFMRTTYAQGQEPAATDTHGQILKAAKLLGISPSILNNSCCDEANTDIVSERGRTFGAMFQHITPGAIANREAVQVGNGIGHAHRIILLDSHLGAYTDDSDTVLYGRWQSPNDGAVRNACGALGHVLNRYLGKEVAPEGNGEISYVGALEAQLAPYKAQVLAEYARGADENEQKSNALRFLSLTNCAVQTQRAIQFAKQANSAEPVLVYGTLTLNHTGGQPDALVLRHAYLVLPRKDENTPAKVLDLSAMPLPLHA